MSSELKVVTIIASLAVYVLTTLILYAAHSNYENRKVYLECLKTAEVIAKANPESYRPMECKL